MTRLLLDAGPYSLRADRITGIGLRIAELAETLAVRFPVSILVDDPRACVPVGAASLVSTVDLSDHDVVFFFDLPDRGRLDTAVRAGKRIVTENAPPIEHLEYPSMLRAPDPAAVHRGLVAGFMRQLHVSHHFLCRSGVERATLLASLCVAGRIGPDDVRRSRTLAHLVSTIPIGYSAASAASAAAAEPRPIADVLWTGGLWSYFDPLLLVDALAVCRSRGVDLTAAFLYARPDPDTRGTVERVARRVAELGLDDAVTLCADPPRHDERDGILKAAKALACVARPGIENDTCVRLRIRDSRLYGVPTIVDPSGPTSTELTADGLGYVLADHTAEALADALVKVPAGGAPREEYRYDRTVGNLTAWLEGTLDGT